MSSSTASITSPASAPPGRSRELWALLLTALIGLPAAFLFARAMADAETRRHEAPVRAMIGNGAFEHLRDGEQTATHYYGNTLGAPDFTLTDQYGQPFRLSDMRGKLVIMNFWTITCQPCVEEMPSLVQLAEIVAQTPDIELVAITSDKRWSDIETLFPPSNKLRVLFDPERKVMRELYGSKMFPETWIVDRNGVIRLRVDGPREWASPLSLDVINSFL